MRRWTGYAPIDGTVVKRDGPFTALTIPPSYFNGKRKLRVRAVLWPDRKGLLTPVIDGLEVKQTPSVPGMSTPEVIRGAVPAAGEYVKSTVFVHSSADNGNSLAGRAERVADRLVLGSYPIPMSVAADQTVWLDTAAGWQCYAAIAAPDNYTFGGPCSPEWHENQYRDLGRHWTMATPHPNGGVSFGRMLDFYAGPDYGIEIWYCDAPHKTFGMSDKQTVPGHQAESWVYDGSGDVATQPYGPSYMCAACRQYAADNGYADVGFGGENGTSRFIPLIASSDPPRDYAMFISRYSVPAAVSGRAYEFYAGHSPVHNTVASAVLSECETDAGFVAAAQVSPIDNDGDGVPDGTVTESWPWSKPQFWGRAIECRGLLLNQLTTRPLPNDMWAYDPWFSENRATPKMVEFYLDLDGDGTTEGYVDMQAPRQYMDARSSLSSALPVGEWSFPTEAVFKYRSKPDEVFHESLPIDEALGMRLFHMGFAEYKQVPGAVPGLLQYGGPPIWRDGKWLISVDARHFYVGSDSATLSTGKAPHTGMNWVGTGVDAFRKFMLLATVGGLGGAMVGLATGMFDDVRRMAWEPRYLDYPTGVAGDGDKPTRYLRMQYDPESRLYLVRVPDNMKAGLQTTLPNGSIVPYQERTLETRFGCVPSASGCFDQRGEVVVVWPHSKRWQYTPTLVAHTRGRETQWTDDTYQIAVPQPHGADLTASRSIRGYAANPNRVHRVADYGARNVQLSAHANNRYAIALWDQYVADGLYESYLQLFDPSEVFAPHGVLRTINGGVKAFVPSEQLDVLGNVDGSNRGARVHAEALRGCDFVDDPELQRRQEWRHVYPHALMENHVVLLVGDKELFCRWDGESMVVQAPSGQGGACADDVVGVAHVFLRIVPFSLLSPQKGDATAIELASSELITPPPLSQTALCAGYNPTVTAQERDVLVFCNVPAEPGRVPVPHGGGFQEFEVTIEPGQPAAVRLYGAPLKPAPDESVPFLQLYACVYPATSTVRQIRVKQQFLADMLSQHLRADTNQGNVQANLRASMQAQQDDIAEALSRTAVDEGPLIARDGPALFADEFKAIYQAASRLAQEYTQAHGKPGASEVTQWAQALLDRIYWAEPRISRRQAAVIIQGILEGQSDGVIAYALATRSYLQANAECECPTCKARELHCDEIYQVRNHMLGRFRCGHCGRTFEDDAHYVSLEYVDAEYDPYRLKTWLVGGLFDENPHIGVVDGSTYLTWSYRESGVWAAERALPLGGVDYGQILYQDPGPSRSNSKPYLWDTADQRPWFTGALGQAGQERPQVDKLPPPVEDGLQHLTYVPAHKPKVLVSASRIVVITLTRELYDAELARREREPGDAPPGDHVANTATPTIPRVMWSADGILWSDDYKKTSARSAPAGDVYEEPKRDYWELPVDLKTKTGQG